MRHHLGSRDNIVKTYTKTVYLNTFFSSCVIFDASSPNIDEVLSVNLFANVFAFEDFNIHQKD